MNTIFALCSGKGKAGVAVFRISGPESLPALSKLTQKNQEDFVPRKLLYTKIYNPQDGDIIDEGMAVYFSADSSFTGEECVEIHTHGSIAVIKLLYRALSGNREMRMAEPGEFARRAFINGKFDLTAAEGLADLIEAETAMQHSQAIRQLGGGLHDLYEKWRQELIEIMANLEAYIDFPDEEIPDDVTSKAHELADNLSDAIKKHLADNRRGERLRDGLKLAMIGKPNVGKSSLLNLLMQRDVAIVSDMAGTTRDVIEGHLDINGYPIILQDTAGIRSQSSDKIEMAGIDKAKEVHNQADIKLIVLDAANDLVNIGSQLDVFRNYLDDGVIIVINKIDLQNSIDKIDDEVKAMINDNISVCRISAKKEDGLDQLLSKIGDKAELLASPSESPQITRERHRAQLEEALVALKQFKDVDDLVLAVEDLRMTIRYLSNITGDITVDEILGEIFSKFCIGK